MIKEDIEMNNKTVNVSIVIPVFCNEKSLVQTFEIIKEKVIENNRGMSFEVIFIDDGSTDNSFNELLLLRERYRETIKIIKFTRNFGQVSAIMAGYRRAKGSCIINISADLQDPPELINEMLEYHLKEKCDVVICTRESRDESFYRRKTSSCFYKLFRRLCFPNMPEGGFDFALISNKVKDVIMERPETNPFWQGQILWTGYQVKYIPYKRKRREFGDSKWTFFKKVKYLIDGIVSYSYFPIRLVSLIGCLVALTGFIYAIVIILARIYGKVPFKGWAPIMVLILMLAGIQMLMLGIVGEYLWRTLEQVRNRHPYIIENVYE